MMVQRRVHDDEKHIHFVTFSCYKRRQHLQTDLGKQVVIGNLSHQLTRHDGLCLGFVIMPNHVHALVWFTAIRQISVFMNKWKDQSSHALKELFHTRFPQYQSQIPQEDPIWQARYYDFNIWSRQKVLEKLNYMHMNPVKAGFVQQAVDWPWGSARWYLQQRSVGVTIRWPPGLEIDDPTNAS